jgi:hypothetical protein
MEMTLEKPGYLNELEIIGAPISYKWSDKIACHFDEMENPKLIRAVDQSNFKAKMAIGAMITELVMWRYDGQAEISDGLKRAEAAWACAIDRYYSKDLSLDLSGDFFQDEQPIEGPIECALDYLETIYNRYTTGEVYLADAVTTLIFVAFHCFPNKKKFSAWLSETLRHTAKVFPVGIDEDEFYDLESYDCSHEKPCFRAFFEPGFEYAEESAREAINRFLQSLNPNDNPYLRTPEEMKAAGFSGIPYTY